MIRKLTDKIIENFMNDLDTEDNREKLMKKIIDPLIKYISLKMYPYVLTTATFFILIFIIMTIILFLLLKLNIYNQISKIITE